MDGWMNMDYLMSHKKSGNVISVTHFSPFITPNSLIQNLYNEVQLVKISEMSNTDKCVSSPT